MQEQEYTTRRTTVITPALDQARQEFMPVDYQEQGFFFPYRVLSHAEACAYAAWIERLPEDQLRALDVPWIQKSYLLFPMLDQLIRRPTLLAAVERVLGPDILVLGADVFIKPPRSPRRITWHQDVNYWGLEPNEVMTAWVAFTDATRNNGCMQFNPGGHLHERLPHRETHAADNMLSYGQEIAVDIDETRSVFDELEPGQASFHHGLMPHASGPNHTDRPRIGFAIRYAPAYVRQTRGPEMTAMLVRGSAEKVSLKLERRPDMELDDAAIAAHRDTLLPHAATRFSTV